jgi:ubiquinone/menaquinone biosynthesis C-methylase UbiE
MASKKIWLNAQKAEEKYWMSKGINIKRTILYWNKKLKAINLSFDYFKQKEILEIGCGPSGIINFIPRNNLKIGVDPLILKYREKLVIKSNTNFLLSVSEFLPFKNNSVNILFAINMLDHCQNPIKVIREIRRIIKKDGVFILNLNIYNRLNKIYIY